MSQWALGYEATTQWQPIRNVLGNLPHPPGKDPIGHLDTVAPGSRRVSVVGWALDPETDLPMTVTLTVGSVRVAVLADVDRPGVAHAYYGDGPFHGFAATVAAAPGAQRVCAYAHGIGTGATSRTLGCVTVNVPG